MTLTVPLLMTLRTMLFQIGKIILFMKGSPLLSLSLSPLPLPLHTDALYSEYSQRLALGLWGSVNLLAPPPQCFSAK